MVCLQYSVFQYTSSKNEILYLLTSSLSFRRKGKELLHTFFLFKFLEYAVILIHTCLLRLLATQFLNKGFILTLEKHIYAQNKLRIRICCRGENFFATSSAPKLENYRVSQQVWNRLKAMFWSLDMFASEASSVYEKMYFCA